MALPALAMAGIGAGLGALGGLFGRDPNQSTVGYTGGSNQGQANFTPAPAASPLYGYMAGIGQQMGNTPTPYFPGQGYVGPSGPTQQGINLGMGTLPLYGAAGQQMMDAQHGMRGVLGQGWNNYNFLSNAADVGRNPYVQDMMQQNADLLNRNFNEGLMPSIRGTAIQNNNLGGSRQGIAEGVAARGTQEAISDANERLLLGAYGQGLGAQQTALGSTGAMLGNLLAPAQATAGAAGLNANAAQLGLGFGQTVEGYQQRALQDAMARFGYQYEEPWMRAGNIQGAMGALAPLGTQNTSGATTGATTGTNPNYQSPFGALTQGAIGGGLMGYGMGQSQGFNPGSAYMSAMRTNPQNFGTFPAFFPR
jgi:hypothetical protein